MSSQIAALAFLRAGSLRVGAYLGRWTGEKSASLPRFISPTRSTTFYGFSAQLGGQIRIKVTRYSLNFKLIDFRADKTFASSFTVNADNLLDIKRKSGTYVQFKFRPDFLSNVMVRLGLETSWNSDRVGVHLPANTIQAMLNEFQAVRYAREELYGLFHFKKRYVPFMG